MSSSNSSSATESPERSSPIIKNWRPEYYPLYAAPPGFDATANPHGKGPPFFISDQILYSNSASTSATLHPQPPTLLILPAEILLQIYRSLSLMTQRHFGLTCKHTARLAMQGGVKPYVTLEEAFLFFISLEGWMNQPQNGVKTAKYSFCERCWVYHRDGGGCFGRSRGRKKAVAWSRVEEYVIDEDTGLSWAQMVQLQKDSLIGSSWGAS